MKQKNEIQNPVVHHEPCAPTQHRMIPINVLRGKKTVHVITLCQSCGIVSQTVVPYPPAYVPEDY